MATPRKSPLMIIFTIVLVDLIGFGMVIPLIGLYGKHYGANSIQLALLGGIYSLMQFVFSPFWGSLSDHIGRRPILLISLLGSTLSYIVFGLAPDYSWLLVSRAFGGMFAANISTAQAYIADITTSQERAKGMGLIGAAFGIGFTLGPPLGGIASARLGLAAPGLIAAFICGANFLVSIFRLPETLEGGATSGPIRKLQFGLGWRQLSQIARNLRRPQLGFFLVLFFFITFAFSTMEQTFSLLFQDKFQLGTGEAGYRTGLVLMVSGLVGAFIQGGLIRRLVQKFGEARLLVIGLIFNAVSMAAFPFGPNYLFYFLLSLPLAFGSSLINPSLSSLISKSASVHEQGSIFGISQGLGSLARATGPFVGLMTFSVRPSLPYLLASLISVFLFVLTVRYFKQVEAQEVET